MVSGDKCCNSEEDQTGLVRKINEVFSLPPIQVSIENSLSGYLKSFFYTYCIKVIL